MNLDLAIPDEITRVARDLTAIADLATHLEAAAIAHGYHADDPADDPLLAELGPTSGHADWERRLALREHDGIWGSDDDADDWTSLNELRFWSEGWRAELGRETDWPTIASEARFCHQVLHWAYEHEPHWDDFARDMARVRRRLEDRLREGEQHRHGAPCLTCGRTLRRTSRAPITPHWCPGVGGVCAWPHQFCAGHDRGGLEDEWVCPGCRRRYSHADYERAVHAGYVAHAEYLPLEDAVARTGVPRGSVQGWASRGLVATRRDPYGGRMLYRVADLERRAGSAKVAQ